MKQVQTGNCPIGDVKRFYVDTVIRCKCPHCGAEMCCDLSHNYLSYPDIGSSQLIYLYCDGCKHGYNLPITLTRCEVTIEFNPNELKEV